MKKELKILLADDHAVVRNGVKLMLSQQKAFKPLIYEVESGIDAIKAATNDKFDVILLDVNLPLKNGVEATKLLTKKKNSQNILVLSMHMEEFVIKQMVAAGALGYILKTTGVDELTKAILTIAGSQKYFCNEVSQVLINNSTPSVYRPKAIKLKVNYNKVLSNREKEVMHLIVKEFSSHEIAEKLFISKRTVDGHRKSIIAKLNLKNTAGIVKYAIQNGIIGEQH